MSDQTTGEKMIPGGKITALRVQKRNPQRINVYLDGEYAFGLARITAAWLSVGQELSAEKIAQLQADDGNEVAYQRSLHFLSYRPRSSAEVRRNLEKHGVSENVIRETLDRLQNAGLVNDASFARSWVENRSDFRPRSRRALAIELRQRGLNQDEIEKALEDVDEETLAYQAALKQVRKLSGLPALDFRHKLISFLTRRGFGYEVIKPVVQKILNEINENTGNEEVNE